LTVFLGAKRRSENEKNILSGVVDGIIDDWHIR
jgi:hypothetical protein